MNEPYEDVSIKYPAINNHFFRTFKHDINPQDLVWHRDRNHRTIRVIEGQKWYLQFDNELPIVLEVGKEYHIPKEQYHRIIKGGGNLVLEIKE